MNPSDPKDKPFIGRLLPAALLAGAIGGLIGATFRLVLVRADDLRNGLIAWSHRWPGIGWLAPVLAAGAATAFARFLVRHFAPSAAGSGVPRIEAEVRDGVDPDSLAVLPVKFVGGLAAIGAGLALGREGPTVQMGGLIGGTLGRLFRLGPSDRRVLVAGGAAAGLATAFGAPLGGAVFILEEVLQRFDGLTTIAVLGATGAATAVFHLMLGDGPEFVVHDLGRSRAVGLLLFLGFGLLLGALGALYNRLVLSALDLDERFKRVPSELRAGLIGAGVGLLACVAPELVSGGDSQVQQLLSSQPLIGSVAVLILARFVLGPVSYASGTPGGLFAPVLLVGAALGAATGGLTSPRRGSCRMRRASPSWEWWPSLRRRFAHRSPASL